MAEFVASTPITERLLEDLHDEITRAGGVIHDQVRLCERDGDFSVEAPGDISPQTIILAVPQSLLLPISAFDLRLEGNDICVGKIGADVSDAQRKLMEIVLGLFNETSKVAQHRAQSLFPLIEHAPDVLSSLSLRLGPEHAPDDLTGTSLLAHFLNARVLSVPSSHPKGGLQKVLMPVIDFLNHAPRAAGYLIHNGSLVAMRGWPAQSSDECHICYGRYDALDLVLKYGYVAEELGFAISKPMEIELESGHHISILRTGQPMDGAQIPDTFKDLGWILPAIGTDAARRLLQFQYFPLMSVGKAVGQDAAWRQFLQHLVGEFLGEEAAGQTTPTVAYILRAVAEENMRHYKAARSAIAATKAAPEIETVISQLNRMLDIQQAIFADYVDET